VSWTRVPWRKARSSPEVELTDKIDYEKALLDPGSVFLQPEDVLTEPALSRQEKTEILRRWEYDESEIAVAVEEGMPDGESTLLRRILLVLEQLCGGSVAEYVGPTKQHGLPGTGTTGSRRRP
jgi:hypothetical protein